jgi:hypothetical protein
MEDELVIRGSLEESAFPELLRSICRSRESGVLTCHTGDARKSIFIDKGQILFASSSNFDDRLGESLLRYGKITVRNFLDATKNVRAGRRLGAILCESNAITAEELVDGVRTQVKDIILSLFSVVKGPYELVLKEIDTHEMILLNTTTEDVIFEGVKSIQSWSRISKGIGSYTSVLVPATDFDKVLLHVSLSAEESHIFSLCEKRRFNVEEICGMSYLNNFETCRLLWAFMMVGALEVMESAPERTLSMDLAASADAESDLHDLVEKYNDVYSFIYDYTFDRIGEQTQEMTRKAMHQVQDTMPNVTKDLKLDLYGRLDFDAILKNLAPIPENGRMELLTGALEEIVFALLYEIGSHFGPAEQQRLTNEVQRMKSM